MKNEPTVVDKLNAARNRALTVAAMTNQYKESWGSEYALKELSGAFSHKEGFGRSALPVITQEELKSLGRDLLYSYGFGNWDDELILVPLWLVNFMEQEEIYVSIMGDQKRLSECNKDVRGGCIAYGFYLRQD